MRLPRTARMRAAALGSVLAVLAAAVVVVMLNRSGSSPARDTAPDAAPIPAPPERQRNPTGQFYVVGSQIVDPDGQVFVPVGANVGTVGNFDWAGVADGHVEAALAWGWNTVRLTVYCTDAQSFSRVTAKDGDAVLLADIDRVVQEYTARKVVVMVECHDATQDPTGAETFWTHVAERYKSNPYVWFNYANEPQGSDNQAWVADQKRWLAVVRATGAENLFVADVMNKGNDAGWSGAKKVYDPSMGPAVRAGQCNVLFSMHNYGGLANSPPPDDTIKTTAYESYFRAVQAAGLAMVIGEFGIKAGVSYDVEPGGAVRIVKPDPKEDFYNHEPNGEWASTRVAPRFGIGALAWHATFADGFTLAAPDRALPKPTFANVLNAGRTGFAPGVRVSQLGKDLWELGHNRPAAQAFTGRYADSGCPSAR